VTGGGARDGSKDGPDDGPGGDAPQGRPISAALGRHYEQTFARFGATSQGVDWGADQARLDLRYEKMLAVLDGAAAPRPSLLDAGCGFGGLLAFARARGIDLDYVGVDMAPSMIDWARGRFPDARFLAGDVFDDALVAPGGVDYVVCNGILTQKLDVPLREMDGFARDLIRRLFALARRGVAFNVMTDRVNFFAGNLFYKSPVDMLAWCLAEITPRVRLDHSYPLYEYTVYLMRDEP